MRLSHLCFSHHEPPVFSLQSIAQYVGGSSGLWILPWCHQCKWGAVCLFYNQLYLSVLPLLILFIVSV